MQSIAANSEVAFPKIAVFKDTFYLFRCNSSITTDYQDFDVIIAIDSAYTATTNINNIIADFNSSNSTSGIVNLAPLYLSST